jgi:hypothetical protein
MMHYKELRTFLFSLCDHEHCVSVKLYTVSNYVSLVATPHGEVL